MVTTAEDIRNWWARETGFDSKIGGTASCFFERKSVTQ
jgi:hypothetical protein